MDIQPPKGYKFNDDEKTKMIVIQGLKERDGYCPCIISKKENYKCPCIDMRKEGICRCGLFVKEGSD